MKLCIVVLSAIGVITAISLFGRTRLIALRSGSSLPMKAVEDYEPGRWGMVRGIDHIGICATGLARSIAFYETLGFSEAYRTDDGVMMAAGTVQLFLFAVRPRRALPLARVLGPFGKPPGIDHISLTVADVDALYHKLRQTGIVLGGPPEDQPWGARIVGLKDPDGNELYLLERFKKPVHHNVHQD